VPSRVLDVLRDSEQVAAIPGASGIGRSSSWRRRHRRLEALPRSCGDPRRRIAPPVQQRAARRRRRRVPAIASPDDRRGGRFASSSRWTSGCRGGDRTARWSCSPRDRSPLGPGRVVGNPPSPRPQLDVSLAQCGQWNSYWSDLTPMESRRMLRSLPEPKDT
jgi:hypothetical protein